jgi:antitoxin (DNA-binding transcriptional repressor) of toxin-antitoxin stability system
MTFELNDLPRWVMELRLRLHAGEEITLTDSGEAIGTVVPKPVERPTAPQRIGFAKGSIAWMAPDFDDPLPDTFWLGEGP